MTCTFDVFVDFYNYLFEKHLKQQGEKKKMVEQFDERSGEKLGTAQTHGVFLVP